MRNCGLVTAKVDPGRARTIGASASLGMRATAMKVVDVPYLWGTSSAALL
jgi:hypothetical protein